VLEVRLHSRGMALGTSTRRPPQRISDAYGREDGIWREVWGDGLPELSWRHEVPDKEVEDLERALIETKAR
jgi:hypothetical protein